MKENKETKENKAPKEPQAPAAPPCYANRELSWLQFNQRVLEEAQDPSNPLMERLSFASIFQSNLDEFYMVRVGLLLDSPQAVDDKTGMTCEEQIAAILDKTRPLLAEKDRIFQELAQELAGCGVELCQMRSLPDKTLAFLEKYFTASVLPLLSPQIIGRKQPFPFLKNKAIYAVAMLTTKNGGQRMGIVSCGDGTLRRLVPLPGEGQRFVLTEDLILHFLPKLFVHYKVDGSVLIRVLRNADINVDDSGGDDMLAEEYRESMEKLVRRRKRLSPVRLEYKGRLTDDVRGSLCRYLGLSKRFLFESAAPLNLSFSGLLRDMLRDQAQLFYPRRVPQGSPNVDPALPMAEQIRRRDMLLAYPYESIRPLLRLLQEAGEDPAVVSIKMTLYRVAHNSKIVEALVDAAENGKEVVVLVELRARFDEENNIGWSRVLEQAGCRVIYGLDGLKVHSKLLLITRVRDGDQVEYITQIGTGNYNEDTVRIYTDYALLTADPAIGADAANLFNCLSIGEVVENTSQLLAAPACLRSRILDLMDREIAQARAGNPAYLGFKLNGLNDKVLIDKLLEASQAGVRVDLLVRGICCLVGGVPGLSDNIRVGSIVGRYLEHARIYLFGPEGRRSVYISSADFMTRNTLHRVEVAAPVRDPDLRRRVEDMFFDQLRDTAKLRVQGPGGVYVHQTGEGEPFNAQEHFYDTAYNGGWALASKAEAPAAQAAPEAVPAPKAEAAKAAAPAKTAQKRALEPSARKTRLMGLLRKRK